MYKVLYDRRKIDILNCTVAAYKIVLHVVFSLPNSVRTCCSEIRQGIMRAAMGLFIAVYKLDLVSSE